MTDGAIPKPGGDTELKGLTSADAARRLSEFGPNAIPEPRPHPVLAFLAKFWAPVPWMLEATIVLELALGKHAEALIIAALLVFNAAVSLLQESRAQNALAMLRGRLEVRARVLRDARWRMVAARELVVGDVIHIRLGDLVPADVRLVSGEVLLDQSALTGESLPVEAAASGPAFAGTIVRRGEATCEVTATGARTRFGRTAELVGQARMVSHLEAIIFAIVKYMVALDGVLVTLMLAVSIARGVALGDIIPYALILLVASVPVALPATFTLATALGSLELVRSGVLATRLSAIEEAAGMDLVCSDKTGTITENRLAVAALQPYPPFSEADLLAAGAFASDDATQDPIDVAILAAARAREVDTRPARRVEFVPFEPATKLSEAVFERDGARMRAIKGAPQAVAQRAGSGPNLAADVERLAANGYRVLAVATGRDGAPRLAGLIALEDPPRKDSRALIGSLGELGVRVVMVTGDGVATARAVASEVGIGDRPCGRDVLAPGAPLDITVCDVFAGVFPEDKYRLVRLLQGAGHIVGMTGDGVNDAPALKQAEVGIAVANATDVAKAAASVVLTNPGLSDVLAAVRTSRRIYQRMLTYTLNKIIKTIEIAVFLSLGVMLTGDLIITPLLVVLLLFANDFVTMSIATDRVGYSRRPDRWRIGTLVECGAALAALMLALSFSVFYAGRLWLGLGLPQLQTLVFVTLVFTGQGNVYLVRERGPFWRSRPSAWMVAASCADVAVVSALAVLGILMSPLRGEIVGGLLLLCLVYLCAVDFVKVRIFKALALAT
jgi:H+-transporting ATPase